MARPWIQRPAPRVYDNSELPFVLPHPRYDVAQLVPIIGKKGFGKTTGEQHYIEVTEPRILVVTTKRDFQRVELADDLEHALNDLSYGVPCRRRVFVDRRSCGGFESLFEYGEYLLDRCCDDLRNVLLVIAEAHLFIEPAPKPPSSALVDLISQGRHYGIRLMVDSQHPRFLQPIFFLEATHLVSFHLSHDKDLETVESHTSTEAAETVAALDTGKCIVCKI